MVLSLADGERTPGHSHYPGQLPTGDEATFLVLQNDPVASLRALLEIRLRIRRGAVVESPGAESGQQAAAAG